MAAAKSAVSNQPDVTALERSGSSLVLQSDAGSTTIQPHVVAKIAGLAVREVEGVHGLVPYGAGQAISNLARAVTGSEARDLGVSVEVGKVEAAIDVRIVTIYGASIPTIADGIRDNVERRIFEMTGLKVKETNIEVVDLYFPGDDQQPAKTSRVE